MARLDMHRTIRRLEWLRRRGLGHTLGRHGDAIWSAMDLQPEARAAFDTPDDVSLKDHLETLTYDELQRGLDRLRGKP